jgi:hypothetical protein
MKNIHVVPTDKPSRLLIDTIENKLYHQPILHNKTVNVLTQNIYITNDEEIKVGDWYYLPRTNGVYKCNEDPTELNLERRLGISKVILTTDQSLDGVQAIDDEFLEWFVKNPSCEWVEVKKGYLGMGGFVETNEPLSKDKIEYKIIIPKEEPKQELPEFGTKEFNDLCFCFFGGKPKQETLEEVAKKYATNHGMMAYVFPEKEKSFIDGAKWQQERSYSEEEVLAMLSEVRKGSMVTSSTNNRTYWDFDIKSEKKWFEQFKNK